ncbi:MAG TPA: cytidylate kinase-like family protein [Armatimonadota bacterium]
MIISISRQTATNGELIGRLVAERLGLRYMDRELVDELARRLQVDPNIVTKFDEVSLNPVRAVLWEWLANINEQVYQRSLRQALAHILEEGNTVVIGRGANFVLRCPPCLHVRIVAPLPLRVAIYRAEHEVSEHEAEHLLQQGDHDRAQFIRTIFHQNIDDPLQYDLSVNLAGLTPEMAADIIVHAAQVRSANRLPTEPHATLPQHIEIMGRHRRPTRPATLERTQGKNV